MNDMIALLRRELWENRGSFMTTPIVIGGLILLTAVVAAAVGLYFENQFDPDGFTVKKGLEQLKQIAPEELPEARAFFTGFLWMVSAVLNLGLTIVVFFYLLGALYDDRRDGSVMFWRSLPVSDFATVLSKLVAAMALAPLITLAAIIVVHVGLLLLGIVLTSTHGLSAGSVLELSNPVPVWPKLLLAYFVQGFWALPVYGWLLLVSAAARSKPFLWAFLPPIVIGLLLGAVQFARSFSFDGYFFITEFFRRLFLGALPVSINIERDSISVGADSVPVSIVTYSGLLERFTEPAMWGGIAVGVAFIAIAVYVRRYRTET